MSAIYPTEKGGITMPYIADTFNHPKPIERDKLVLEGREDPMQACNCRELGGAPRGHNHHPDCNIWRTNENG